MVAAKLKERSDSPGRRPARRACPRAGRRSGRRVQGAGGLSEPVPQRDGGRRASVFCVGLKCPAIQEEMEGNDWVDKSGYAWREGTQLGKGVLAICGFR
jgi:hypothetical protein